MNDNDLELNIKNHYTHLYGTPPPTQVTWERIAANITVQEQNLSWWKRILQRGQHVTEPTIGRRAYRRPVRRIGFSLAAVLLALLVLTATGYASLGNGPLNTMLNLGFKPIAQQFSDYHQSQSIDGYTLSIQKVFADSNKVIIGVTGEGPAGSNITSKFPLGLIRLTTEQGNILPNLSGSSTVESTNGSIFEFDASSIQGTPKDLHLHLAVPYRSQQSTSHSLTFDFSVPFHPGKIIPINSSVTASGTATTEQITVMDNNQLVKQTLVTLNGQTITLEQAVITPSEVSFTTKLPFFFDQFKKTPILLDYAIKLDGQNYKPSLLLITGTNSDVWHMHFEDPTLASKKGLWTLTIQQEFGQINAQTGQNEKKTVPGAIWTFQFNVG